MREHCDIAAAEIGPRGFRILQIGEAEERHGIGADRKLDGTEALLDLLDGVLAFALREVGMRPSVATDTVARGSHLLENFWVIQGMLANREEDRLGAVI